MPQSASIGLYPNLYETLALLLAHRFDPQTWRVGMGADHRNRVARLPLLANGESHKGRAIASQIVLAARLAS